jgi:hypothetical protein
MAELEAMFPMLDVALIHELASEVQTPLEAVDRLTALAAAVNEPVRPVKKAPRRRVGVEDQREFPSLKSPDEDSWQVVGRRSVALDARNSGDGKTATVLDEKVKAGEIAVTDQPPTHPKKVDHLVVHSAKFSGRRASPGMRRAEIVQADKQPLSGYPYVGDFDGDADALLDAECALRRRTGAAMRARDMTLKGHILRPRVIGWRRGGM